MLLPRVHPSTLRLRSGRVLVTGGITGGNSICTSCELVGNGPSERLTCELKHARYSHSMVDVGEWIYVFGGMSSDIKKPVAAVERIKVTDGSIAADATWEVVG
jgi:hypothetical protein